MEHATSRIEPDPLDEFTYYMVRIRHSPADDRDLLAGIIERLGSGEKQGFAGADELIRLLNAWTEGAPNMRVGTDRSKS